jgi:hypothetical protein
VTENMLEKLFVLLHRPIPWDPIPWWVKLDEEHVRQFNDVQVSLNTKMAEIQAQKIEKLSKIANIPMK